MSREGKTALSVHQQSASLTAIDLQRFAETLVNLTERRILENMAVHLSARISALARAIVAYILANAPAVLHVMRKYKVK